MRRKKMKLSILAVDVRKQGNHIFKMHFSVLSNEVDAIHPSLFFSEPGTNQCQTIAMLACMP